MRLAILNPLILRTPKVGRETGEKKQFYKSNFFRKNSFFRRRVKLVHAKKNTKYTVLWISIESSPQSPTFYAKLSTLAMQIRKDKLNLSKMWIENHSLDNSEELHVHQILK
jgi:hypothetical protein